MWIMVFEIEKQNTVENFPLQSFYLQYIFTKSPFPFPESIANDFGRTMDNDKSPTKTGTLNFWIDVFCISCI